MTASTRPHPAEQMIPLSEQFDNHDGYRPDVSTALAGTEISLVLDDRGTLGFDFLDAEQVVVETADSEFSVLNGEASYEAVELRPGIFQLVVARLDRDASLLAIIDVEAKRVLLNLSIIVDQDGRRLEHTTFTSAGLGQPIDEPYTPTDELIGKRVLHRYSDTHTFEHIYLSQNLYAFQGLAGPEKDLGDVDVADYFKLGEDLYLFSWHERAQPFNGAVILDLAAGKTVGRLFGWEAQSGNSLQVRTGAYSTLLNETTYDL